MAETSARTRDYILDYCDRMRVEQDRISRRALVNAAWPDQPIESLRANLARHFDVRQMPDRSVEVHRVA